MGRFYLSAIGADRPGIAAAVTKVLMDEGCNLEDSAMTILRGQFAIMVLVDAPRSSEGEGLERALAGVSREFDLVTVVRPVHEAAASAVAGESWTVSVHGADRPGIVHRVTSVLAAAGANIVELATRVLGEPSDPAYVMILTVTIPDGVDGASLSRDLDALADELGVHCAMHPSDADIL